MNKLHGYRIQCSVLRTGSLNGFKVLNYPQMKMFAVSFASPCESHFFLSIRLMRFSFMLLLLLMEWNLSLSSYFKSLPSELFNFDFISTIWSKLNKAHYSILIWHFGMLLKLESSLLGCHSIDTIENIRECHMYLRKTNQWLSEMYNVSGAMTINRPGKVKG